MNRKKDAQALTALVQRDLFEDRATVEGPLFAAAELEPPKEQELELPCD